MSQSLIMSRSAATVAAAALATLSFTLLPGAARPARAQTFAIQGISEIPPVPGTSRNAVVTSGLSGNGTVALTTQGTTEVARYLSGPQSTNLGGIGGPGFGAAAQGIGVNDAGFVVGRDYVSANNRHAFVSKGGTGGVPGLTDLHATITGLAGVSAAGESFATDINTTGQIAGYYSTRVPRGPQDAYLLSADRQSLVNISEVSVASGGVRGGINYAMALNDAGQVVGEQTFNLNSPIQNGFLYSGGVVTRLNAPTGATFGQVSGAFGLSENGQWIAGYYDNLAVRWQPNGTALSLGHLGGFSSTAFGVNNIGLVVGNSTLAGNVQHAFIFQDGRIMDLNSLLPVNSGWVLGTATAINDANQVVGNGLFTNSQGTFYTAYRLTLGNGAVATAAPEPGSLALLLPILGILGTTGQALNRRRKHS